MRKPILGVVSTAAISLLLACGGEPDTPQLSPEPAPDSPAAGAPGAMADCLVGEWESVETTGQIGDNAATIEITGGSGVRLAIQPDGAAALDFNGMEPVQFTSGEVGLELAGELVYAGQASAVLRTDTDGESGNWEPARLIDWEQVRVTVDLFEPVQLRPFDDLPIGELTSNADDWTGDVIDIEPVLGDGGYRCQNDQLLVTGAAPAELNWTFTRT